MINDHTSPFHHRYVLAGLLADIAIIKKKNYLIVLSNC